MSLKVRWLSVFPSAWSRVPSKRLFSESKLKARPEDEQLTASQDYGVIPQREFIRRAGRHVVQINQHLDKRKRVERDDFVISMRSFQGGLERSWASGGIRSSYVVLKPSSEVDIGYFSRLFKSREYIQALQATAHFIRDGQDLNFQQFTLVDLPLPPLETQAQVAKYLDYETTKIDALIEKQQQLIALLQEKRQAIINHAVTKGLNPDVRMRDSGIEWLGNIPAHWKIKKLKHLLSESLRNGVSPQPAQMGGTLTFSIAAVRNGLINVESHLKYADISPYAARPYWVKVGDVMMMRGNGSRDLVGTAGIVKSLPVDRCIYPDILIRLRFSKEVEPSFAVLALNSTACRPQIVMSAKTAAGIWKVSAPIVGEFAIPVPPLDEQYEIRNHLNKALARIESLTARAESLEYLLQERRAALISAAVTGKIDVRDWTPPGSESGGERL